MNTTMLQERREKESCQYIPIEVRIDDRRFFIEDVRRWASGDISDLEDLKDQLIVLFAQLALAWVENWEKEYKNDLVEAFDIDTVTGLHLEWRDTRGLGTFERWERRE